MFTEPKIKLGSAQTITPQAKEEAQITGLLEQACLYLLSCEYPTEEAECERDWEHTHFILSLSVLLQRKVTGYIREPSYESLPRKITLLEDSPTRFVLSLIRLN